MVANNPFAKVLQKQGEPNWRRRDVWLILLFIVALIWASVAKVDRVVTAPGKVVPFNKVKVIQHLEGGIIETLYVQDNQRVAAGDPLIELNLASSGVNVPELMARFGVLQIIQKRLMAETQGTEYVVDNDLPDNIRQSGLAEKNTFKSRTNELNEVVSALEQQLKQAEKRVAELQAKQQSQEQNLIIAEKELAISNNLVADKLVSELEHFQRLRAVETMKGEIAATTQAIAGALSVVVESQGRIREEQARFVRRASDELGDIERQMASVNEELIRAKEQKARSVIRAPIDGFVKNIKYQAIGNVIKPGEPIMEVVPEKDRLVIEVKLSPVDRGFVIQDQEALIKISAYDYFRYGGIVGTVEGIAADTTIGQQEEQYYRIIINASQAYVGAPEQQMLIKPGMTGEVAIKVDSQSVLWALIKPILKIKSEALRET
ncbi:HlyD family type I secretion periplasmic adaptor subunit [Glaciecola sp. HTCC2999]|uniref:HlyD family type I secretion periplasmic adaptor subunit n=1 Tax=Glaciecola sp. HTCC2999 TaxID=455436 RepID=UPI0000E0F5DF|nr:HlyD family type I secretion periplasmic adaptor subunit [Glaciecola sp. HTCC2999]